eukprot:Lankesteria_metandrocarpae@DN9092_c0_g1_i1.p1
MYKSLSAVDTEYEQDCAHVYTQSLHCNLYELIRPVVCDICESLRRSMPRTVVLRKKFSASIERSVDGCSTALATDADVSSTCVQIKATITYYSRTAMLYYYFTAASAL